MKNLFVPYDIAVLAKEKGFNEKCLTTYEPRYLHPNEWRLKPPGAISFGNEDQDDSHKTGFTGYKNSVPAHYGLKQVAAPTYQQLVDWFREKYNVHIVSIEDAGLYSFIIKWHNGTCFNEMPCKGGEYYKALNTAISEAFKLI